MMRADNSKNNSYLSTTKSSYNTLGRKLENKTDNPSSAVLTRDPYVHILHFFAIYYLSRQYRNQSTSQLTSRTPVSCLMLRYH